MINIDKIEAYDYGYGELENKLITVLCTWPVDFESADEILHRGADVNAAGNDADENILSEILMCFWMARADYEKKQRNENDDEMYPDANDTESGEVLVKIIRYFLSNGFDVHKNNDRYGAQCLYALTFSIYDAHIIEATKLLLDAGAKNVCPYADEPDSTPWSSIGSEGSYQDCCCHDHHLGNIYEAVYQIYQAVEDKKDYSQIDSYERAIGKTILKVLSEKPPKDKIFYDMELPESTHPNCFNQRLFFVYDTGVLITTQYADFWVDGTIPDVETIDVSGDFSGIVGANVENITFDHNEIRHGINYFGQPITTILMNNGNSIIFTINFGEVEDENRAAYFQINR